MSFFQNESGNPSFLDLGCGDLRFTSEVKKKINAQEVRVVDLTDIKGCEFEMIKQDLNDELSIKDESVDVTEGGIDALLAPELSHREKGVFEIGDPSYISEHYDDQFARTSSCESREVTDASSSRHRAGRGGEGLAARSDVNETGTVVGHAACAPRVGMSDEQ